MNEIKYPVRIMPNGGRGFIVDADGISISDNLLNAVAALNDSPALLARVAELTLAVGNARSLAMKYPGDYTNDYMRLLEEIQEACNKVLP